MNSNPQISLEGLGKLDPEAQWIATEMATAYLQQQKEQGRKPTIRELVSSYCPTVAELISDRMGVTHDSNKISAKEATDIGSNALINLDKDQKLDFYFRIDIAARFVVAAAKLRAISPVFKSHEEPVEYISFDHGFCNPHKLKYAD